MSDDDPSEFVGWIKVATMEALLCQAWGWTALHAGAIATPRGSVLLAGSSGSGKTTLGAILNYRGFDSIADDVVFVDDSHQSILGLPFAYCAKEDSWPVLARNLAGRLDIESVCTRPDGLRVIYLPPRSVAETAPANLIVFPTFKHGAGIQVDQVPKEVALASLLKEARNIKCRLTRRGFTNLCKILDDARALTITYGDAGTAANALEDLIGV